MMSMAWDRKLVISSVSGVIVACLIIVAISSNPLVIEKTLFWPHYSKPPTPPITVNLTIAQFKEPHGIGSEANLTVMVVSVRNESAVSIQIGLGGSYNGWPCGIDFIWPPRTIDSNHYFTERLLWWRVDLYQNTLVTFNATIKAARVGYASICASATWYDNTTSKYSTSDSEVIYFSVYEKAIFVENTSNYKGWSSLPSNPINYVSQNETYPKSIIFLEPAITEWNMNSYDVGAILKLEVKITNVIDLWSLCFSLKWNASVLELVNVEKGTVLEAEDAMTYWIISNDTTNCVTASYLRIGRWPGAAAVNISEPENGLVATITFRVINYTDGLEISFMNEIDSPYKTVWLSSQADRILDYNFEHMLSATFTFKKD
jgi:hypothetical protein